MAKSHSRKRTPDAPGRGDTGVPLSQLGLTGTVVSRRTALKAGLGVAAGAGLAAVAGTATAPPAQAGLNNLRAANAVKVGQLTGPALTNQFAAHYTDLGIPVQRADGSILYIGGDTYPETTPDSTNDWRSPIGLTSTVVGTNGLRVINGAITDRAGHAKGLVPEGHADTGQGLTTALPSDVFGITDSQGNKRLYMHLMRGVIYKTDHTDFWTSGDNGNTWTYLRAWPGSHRNGFFQQKTYAADTAASDPYVYCLTTAFNRSTYSDMYLFRVFKSDLLKTDNDANASGVYANYAYQPWGFANGSWGWGKAPTSVLERRLYGEICFRAMGGKYALSWFQPNNQNPKLADIRAMVFDYPTSNLVATTEQTMVYQDASNTSATAGSVQGALYGGFIMPGSTFRQFDIVVSNWVPTGPNGNNPPPSYAPQGNYSNYVFSQWRTTTLQG